MLIKKIIKLIIILFYLKKIIKKNINNYFIKKLFYFTVNNNLKYFKNVKLKKKK